MTDISNFAKQIYSQRGEDGMIEKVLQELDITTGWCCEFGAWDGKHLSNLYRLITCGWNALMIEGDPKKYLELQASLSPFPNARAENSYVSLDGHNNLNTILSRYDFPFDFDVLSIDIDSCDYWIWSSLRYSPKLVVIEYNSNWEDSVTVPYLDPFPAWAGSQYYGASAKAMAALGTHKGYDLIGFSPYNNLFFLRKDYNQGRFNVYDLSTKAHIQTPHHSPLTPEEESSLVYDPPLTVSSYLQNDYGKLFEFLVRAYRPQKIVEFGILDGYSLGGMLSVAPNNCQVEAYDIFEDCSFRHADRAAMEAKYPGVIRYGDFYKMVDSFENQSIDLMHIDIGNDGNTYEFFFQNYIPKLSPNGIAILEGGARERDNYFWMKKFNKPAIQPILQKYHNHYNIVTLTPFPSITLVTKKELPLCHGF